MLSIFMVTLREGLEALLVVAITATYLRQTGRVALLAPVRWAVGAALALSLVLGFLLFRVGGMSPLWEGWLAVAAMVMVAWCVVHMMRHGKRMAGEIKAKIDQAAVDARAAWIVFAFILIMVGREGVETATMLASLAINARAIDMVVAGVLGFAAAAAIAGAWLRYGNRVDLGLFFRVTAVFLILFSAQLALYAFHEFTEVGAVPGLDNAWWHMVTEEYGPEGVFGRWFSYSLALVPLAFLAVSVWRHRGGATPAQA
ncbi:MAG: FTR1 family protein [Gammaproteobacteria bacterium]|nr:FTR1 family protein [Gammaproteobacteria bacterium]